LALASPGVGNKIVADYCGAYCIEKMFLDGIYYHPCVTACFRVFSLFREANKTSTDTSLNLQKEALKVLNYPYRGYNQKLFFHFCLH
jgi:hypothetical protein